MKTVCITGISSGIGEALARRFLKENFRVIGTVLPGKEAFTDPNLTIVELDLLDDASIKACAEAIRTLGFPLDIHVNNAGALFDEGEPFVVISKLRKTLQVDLIGAIDLTERLMPLVVKGGHIINVTSSAASLANVHHTDYPAYKIAKAGMNMFTRYLALRLKGFVTVSAVHPGRVKTKLAGWEGEISPEEAARYIFELATNPAVETGQFWFKGEPYPW